MKSKKKDFFEKKAFYTDPDSLAEGFLNTNFIFDAGGESLDGGDYSLRSWRDEFYRWEKGRYIKVSDGEMKRLIKRHLHDLNESVQYSGRDRNQKMRITRYMVNNILLCISGMEGVHIPETVELNSWSDGREKLGIQTFVFNNGLVMIDPKKGKPALVKHTTYYFTLSKLPFDYDPSAKYPRWLQFVSEIFQKQGNDHNEDGHVMDTDADGQSIATLQEFMGLFLTSETKYQKILGIVGPKRSGKGTIGKIFRELVGRENTCFPTLSSLTVEHGLQGLLNKTVAIISDASISGRGSDVIRAVERLKMISGEDGIQVNPKNKPQVDLPKLPVRFLIMSNNLQSLIDPTGALASRFVYLITMQSFYGREDFDLDKKLISELPGIFNWSIEGLQRLSKRGRFLETESGLEAKKMAEELGSPVITFVREWCVIREGQEIKPTDLYRFYKQWTEEAGRGKLGRTKFYEEFQRAFPDCNRKRKRIDGPDSSPAWVFKNINVKEEHYQNHGSNYD